MENRRPIEATVASPSDRVVAGEPAAAPPTAGVAPDGKNPPASTLTDLPFANPSGVALGMKSARIVSGGQTGVDRAALDTAIELAIGHGGWVPCGRAAEDGALAAHYLLRETPDADPAQRTEWNVRDSDATLIVSRGPLRGGSELTRQSAERHGRPCLHLDLATLPAAETAACVGQWLAGLRCATLNIAGPRASEDPAIYAATRSLLQVVLAAWARTTCRPAGTPCDD